MNYTLYDDGLPLTYGLLALDKPASGRSKCKICEKRIPEKFIRGQHIFTGRFYCLKCIPRFINEQKKVLDIIEDRYKEYVESNKSDIMLEEL